MSRSFVAIDVETTGLDVDQDRITEVGAVRFNEDGDELDSFTSLVNPGRTIPEFVERLTGVTNEAVRAAPPLDDIADDILRFIGTDTIVGQNIGFDLAYLRRAGIARPTMRSTPLRFRASCCPAASRADLWTLRPLST
ncbi:MAG: 3'-5' exonuclease [Dehalococcoidia bacterium]